MKFTFFLILSLFCQMLSGQTAYVVNSGSQTLSRIDIVSGEVENAFAILGNQANRVALRGDYLYVVDSGDNNIRKLDKLNGNMVGNIYLGASTNPYDILVLGDFAYVTGGLSNRLYKIDLLTDAVVADIAVGNNPAGMAVWNNKLYVGNTDYASGNYNSSLSVIDLEEFQVIGEVYTAPNPQYLISYNDVIHVSCTGNWSDISGSIQIIDPQTDEIMEELLVGGYPGSLTALGNGIIYIGDSMNSGIYAYDSNNYEVLYNANSPFTPGASTVAGFQNMLFTLGGEWGQNFMVNMYNTEEEWLASFLVGLYATDIIIEATDSGAEDDIVEHDVSLTNYPNPFNPQTEIRCQVSGVSSNDELELTIYNVKGQKIKNLYFTPRSFHPERSRRTGSTHYYLTWNATDQHHKPVSSGVYYACLRAGGKTMTRKMVLLR